MVFRTLTFSGFVASWLVRIVDPRGQHPAVNIELPLPKEVPPTFAALPELLVEDILDFSIFLLRRSPELIRDSADDSAVSPWLRRCSFPSRPRPATWSCIYSKSTGSELWAARMLTVATTCRLA